MALDGKDRLVVPGPTFVVLFVGAMLPVCRIRGSRRLVRLEEPHRVGAACGVQILAVVQRPRRSAPWERLAARRRQRTPDAVFAGEAQATSDMR